MFPSFFPTNTGQTAQSDVDGWITPFLTFVEDVFSLLPQNLNGVRRRLCLTGFELPVSILCYISPVNRPRSISFLAKIS